MRKSRFTDEQIVGFLKQAEAGLAVKELCLRSGFSDATFYVASPLRRHGGHRGQATA